MKVMKLLECIINKALAPKKLNKWSTVTLCSHWSTWKCDIFLQIFAISFLREICGKQQCQSDLSSQSMQQNYNSNGQWKSFLQTRQFVLSQSADSVSFQFCPFLPVSCKSWKILFPAISTRYFCTRISVQLSWSPNPLYTI